MRKPLVVGCFFILCFCQITGRDLLVSGRYSKAGTSAETDQAMSSAYWDLWNPEVQTRIDRDIEKYRKADALLEIEGLAAGTEVKIEQISHDFIFGAHIFNFNQLGTTERNKRYKELYGSLFNSATIAFYWRPFEMQPDRLRFREEYWDTEEYWNQVEEPEKKPHWRRPATDPVVEFCESKGIRLHGHTITWGSTKWQHPEWLFEQFCPDDEKQKFNELGREKLYELTTDQIEKMMPVFTGEINRIFKKRIADLAGYYKGRIHSWDVVNESATDYGLGRMAPGDKICKSHYGLMPGDYTYESFKTANRVFPSEVLLNINDFKNDQNYVDQVNDLRRRGCKIDMMGSQMHLFNPQQCLDIANGKATETPEIVWNKMATLSKAGLPIHLSEITITSPGDDEKGLEIQAVITRNLYRLWFSIEKMMGITWWNVVDGCGAPGEPTISGIFTRDMEPKPSYYILYQLINKEWKTKETISAKEEGIVSFRGFKGEYIVTWKDKNGKENKARFYLKKDGDGFRSLNKKYSAATY